MTRVPGPWTSRAIPSGSPGPAGSFRRTQARLQPVPAGVRIWCTLGLPDGSGYARLPSADPSVQPAFNYRYLQHPNDIRRVREGVAETLRQR